MADVFENTQRPIQTSSDSLVEQRQARLGLIEPIVNSRFPTKDYLAIASQRAGVKVEDLDDDWRGSAESEKRQFEYQRQRLANEIAESNLKPEQVGEYLTTLTAIAEETNVKKGGWDIQDIISLARASDTIEKARLWQKLATTWKSKFVTGVEEGIARQRLNDFNRLLIDLSGHNISPRPPIRSIEEISQLMQVFSEVYGYTYSLQSEEKQKFISRETVGNYTYEKNLLDSMVSNIVRLGLETHDSAQVSRALTLLKDNQQVAPEILGIYIDTVCHYGRNFGLKKEAVTGFQKKLLPALIKGDKQVQILLRGGNIWAMRSGETMGIGDFIYHCYATEVNPPNINDLLLAVREVPTTDYARFEQNRLDALAAGSVFGVLRDFIHDQRPGVSDVIQGMIDYYQTGDKSRLELLLAETGGYLASPDRQGIIFERSNYEREVEETVNGKKNKVKTIEILKRLAENTKPVDDTPPITSDAVLNEKMATLGRSEAMGTTRELLGEAYDYVTTRLIEMMDKGEVGIEPNTLLALAWLERRGFEVLQKLTYEDQIGVYKQKWFHSILRFQEVTFSPKTYDQVEFQSFLDQIAQLESDKEAYQLVGRRILDHVNILARRYKSEGKNERTGALWSGNSVHELIGLIDFRPAITVYGKKHREERQKPEQDRLKGD